MMTTFGRRRWGVAPLRPSIFTPLEAVEGCMAAMTCIGWVSLLWGYFKEAGLLQETSREAKHFVGLSWWFRTPAMKSSDMKIPRFGDKEILHGWVELSTDPIWPDAAVRIQLGAESINGDLYFWMIQRLTWYWPPRLNPWMFFYQCTSS